MSEGNPQFSWLKVSIFAGLLTFALYAFSATRTVVIPFDNAGLTLFNSSTDTVTYNLECYDSAGAIDLSYTHSLAPKNSTSFIAGNTQTACVDTLGTQNFLNGMVECGNANIYNYSTAFSKCSQGYHVCSVAEWDANRNNESANAWLSTVGFSNVWGTSIDTGTNYSAATISAGYVPFAANFNNDHCHVGPGSNGGASFAFCGGAHTSSSRNVMCCPGPGAFAKACKVEITSPGHLSSPQFNGSKPF